MKYNRSNFYINHGAIPSKEYAKNKDARVAESGIEAKKFFQLAGQEAHQLKRASWLLKKNRVSGTRNRTYGRKSNDSCSTLEMFRKYGNAHSMHSLYTKDSL